MPRSATPKGMKRPSGMGDAQVGESRPAGGVSNPPAAAGRKA